MKELNLFEKNKIEQLKQTDPMMERVIEELDVLHMEADSTFFESIVHQLFKQQISTALAEKIWVKFRSAFDSITPEYFSNLSLEDISGFGISKRRLSWILQIARILTEHPDFEEKLWKTNIDDYYKQMVQLPGVGVWTAEMIGIFYFQREDIFSYGDVGIRRGIQAIYKLEGEPSKNEFENYRRLFTPHLSLASIYIWKVYEGFIPEIYTPSRSLTMKDL